MTIERDAAPSRFVMVSLPWLLSAAALLVYVVTLNGWVSLQSLGTVARVVGWLDQPQLRQPLTAVVLLPFRLLPVAWLPVSLNLFSALCGAIVLRWLARVVALLPRHTTPEGPLPAPVAATLLASGTAWLPPVLAVILCGLQLSFWEEATAGTGAMLDLLVVGYATRCLAEYRIDRRESRLLQCAFVYGLGLTNNWILFLYLPVLAVAIVRLRGFATMFDLRFLARLAGVGACGLALYFVLPLVQHWSSHGQLGFWDGLKANLRFQKEALSSVRAPLVRGLLVLSALPLLVLLVRWKSHTVQLGDDSRLGVILIKATGHIAHGAVLGFALWMALDPVLSPRRLGYGQPWLSLYFLFALLGGYAAGYFLLFRVVAPASRGGRIMESMVAMLAVGMAITLACRNGTQIAATNGRALRAYAHQLMEDLPVGRSIILEDDPVDWLLLRAEWTTARAGNKDPLFLDATSLQSPEAWRRAAARFGSRWPNAADDVQPAVTVPTLVARAMEQAPVIALHPVPGALFEQFVTKPNGLLFQLQPRVTGTNLPAELAASIQEQERLWQGRWSTVRRLADTWGSVSNRSQIWHGGLVGLVHLEGEANQTGLRLCSSYSRAFNFLGTGLQQAGEWSEAWTWFERALQLNQGNVCARVNDNYNATRRRGERKRVDLAALDREFVALLDRPDAWLRILYENGPFDEPSCLFRTGRMLAARAYDRQAAVAFARSASLAPEWPPPRLWLAQNFARGGDFQQALALADSLSEAELEDGASLRRLLLARATALRGLGRTNEATSCIDQFVETHRKHDEVLSAAASLFGESGDFGREQSLIEELQKRNSDQLDLWVSKGGAELGLGRFDAAAASLSEVLARSPDNELARLYRAMAYLGAQQFELARGDYQKLSQSKEHSRDAVFGLGTIAWRQRDTNGACQYYRQFVSQAKPGTRHYALAMERLSELQGGSRP